MKYSLLLVLVSLVYVLGHVTLTSAASSTVAKAIKDAADDAAGIADDDFDVDFNALDFKEGVFPRKYSSKNDWGSPNNVKQVQKAKGNRYVYESTKKTKTYRKNGGLVREEKEEWSVHGKYEFKDDKGKHMQFAYSADQNGFHPKFTTD